MQNISIAQLETVTGGLGSGGATGNAGGGSWLSNLGSGISNQWTKTKDAWSSAASMPFEGFSKMISPR